MNDSVTVIQFSNSNNDQIIFYINNLNPNSANFNVINKKDINTNDAFISIKARNTSSINKNNYQSRAGTIHIRYEDSTKTWYLNLCNQAIIDILSLYNYEFDGYFVFK
ncbi:MAG: hypothetical protein Q8K70_01255 [Bacteroidota bacterium]|nr:hypothetical protein [Bacteroidota bacterium]